MTRMSLPPRKWVGARELWLEHHVGVLARRLVSAGAVVAPDSRLLAVFEDPRLRTEAWVRVLSAIDPDVFSAGT